MSTFGLIKKADAFIDAMKASNKCDCTCDWFRLLLLLCSIMTIVLYVIYGVYLWAVNISNALKA